MLPAIWHPRSQDDKVGRPGSDESDRVEHNISNIVRSQSMRIVAGRQARSRCDCSLTLGEIIGTHRLSVALVLNPGDG